jgi:hypothetical protein
MCLLHNVASSGADIINANGIHIKRCVLRVGSSDDKILLRYMSGKPDVARSVKKFNPYRNLNECNLPSNKFCLQKFNVEKQNVLLEK